MAQIFADTDLKSGSGRVGTVRLLTALMRLFFRAVGECHSVLYTPRDRLSQDLVKFSFFVTSISV